MGSIMTFLIYKVYKYVHRLPSHRHAHTHALTHHYSLLFSLLLGTILFPKYSPSSFPVLFPLGFAYERKDVRPVFLRKAYFIHWVISRLRKHSDRKSSNGHVGWSHLSQSLRNKLLNGFLVHTLCRYYIKD